jgi:vacuolar-type H+-ATPase catalytic subunit A/Vma1
MKAVTVKELKLELINRTPNELRELCLRLSKFKKENKELLTYLLFESSDEESYIKNIKRDIDQQFEQINIKSYYYIKKSLRKILRTIRKYIRYSQNKETEIDLLIYFCVKLKKFTPSIQKSTRLQSLYDGQIDTIRKKVDSLHEDLQYDYEAELDVLTGS